MISAISMPKQFIPVHASETADTVTFSGNFTKKPGSTKDHRKRVFITHLLTALHSILLESLSQYDLLLVLRLFISSAIEMTLLIEMGGRKGYNNHMNESANGLFKSPLKRKINLIFGSRKSREEFFEELEEILVLADISMELVDSLLGNVRKRIKLTFDREDFFQILREELRQCFAEVADSRVHLQEGKNVIMLVGINGSGKTTTAAKLGQYYRGKGQRVLLAAADTFRAAGSSQLSLWGDRLGLPVIGGQRGADPGSVVYNSLNSLKTKDLDLLIVDTAGRVQTRENLMKELEKLTQVVKKFYPDQPAEVLLVIDSTMGQNTLDQARKFKDFSGITGTVLAKLDGTAKGGTILNILNALKIPVKFAGTGETEQDLETFSSEQFIDSLLSD